MTSNIPPIPIRNIAPVLVEDRVIACDLNSISRKLSYSTSNPTNTVKDEPTTSVHKDFGSYNGPYKHFWRMLVGDGDGIGVSTEIVHEELTLRCREIISSFMLFPSPEPHQYPEITKSSSTKDRLIVDMMKLMSITKETALDLLRCYFAFEYRGVIKSLEELLPNTITEKDIVVKIKKFYMRERLCLLYCSQVILSEANFTKSPYSKIFYDLIAVSSLEDWTKWLCYSLSKCRNFEEEVEVLHTLAILMFHYGAVPEVLKTFAEEFKFTRHSAKIFGAEGVLILVFIQACIENDILIAEEFMKKNLKRIDENSYFMSGLLAAAAVAPMDSDFQKPSKLRLTIQNLPDPKLCVIKMVNLVETYDGDTYRSRHGLGFIVAKTLFKLGETILEHFDKDLFGRAESWSRLLHVLFKNEKVAHSFMIDQPENWLTKYTEDVMKLPLVVRWPLKFWSSILKTARDDITPENILKRLTELNSIALPFEQGSLECLRPNGPLMWSNQIPMKVGQVIVPAGSRGHQLSLEFPLIVSWELQYSLTDMLFWDTYREIIILPAYKEFPNLKQETKEQIFETAKFLTSYGKLTNNLPIALKSILQFIFEILKGLVEHTTDQRDKSALITYLLGITEAGTIFSYDFLFRRDQPLIWPNSQFSNIVGDFILGYETVGNSNYLVTKAFLRSVLRLFPGKSSKTPSRFHFVNFDLDLMAPVSTMYKITKDEVREMYAEALIFILENIYPSFMRWSIREPSEKYEIIMDTLKIFCALFEYKGCYANALKDKCSGTILCKTTNSILEIITIDEDDLQDCWVRTSNQNQYVDETVFLALELLDKLSDYDVSTLKLLDTNSNLTLVSKLGALIHYRLNSRIPEMSIKLLSKMALELRISVIACFGNGTEAFKDLLLQRLDFNCETVSLKVAILDFLTVCAQTQAGLIEHFFTGDSFVECIMDLIADKNKHFVVPCLALVRALLRKGSYAFKNHDKIWSLIFETLKDMNFMKDFIMRQKAISYAMNIFSFEIYRYSGTLADVGSSSENSSPILKSVIKEFCTSSFIKYLLETTIGPGGATSQTKKCIQSVKHFLTILFARPDPEELLSTESKSDLFRFINSSFWDIMNGEAGEDENSRDYQELLPPMAELLLVIGGPSDPELLQDISTRLYYCFASATLPVQIPLLNLLNKMVIGLHEEIGILPLEALVKILVHVFQHVKKISDKNNLELVMPIVNAASSILYALVDSPYSKNWPTVFQQRNVIKSVMNVVCIGISGSFGVEMVQDCLASLVHLSRDPKSSELLRNSDLTSTLFTPLSTYLVRDEEDGKWFEIFILVMHLTCGMLSTVKVYFLRESLNFWLIHGQYISRKLRMFVELSNGCYHHTVEQNFIKIKNALALAVAVMKIVIEMIPHMQQWRLEQPRIVEDVMSGIYLMLSTGLSLLSQPNHLILLISKPTKGQTTGAQMKLTPQLLEVQTRLWEMLAMGLHLYMKFGVRDKSFCRGKDLLQLSISTVMLCGRVLSKHGTDRKAHPAVNITTDVNLTLQKSLTILACFLEYVAASHEMNQGKGLVREYVLEISSLAEMVERLGLPENDFCHDLLSVIDEKTKNLLSK